MGVKSVLLNNNSSKNTKKHYWIRGLVLGFIFSLIVFIILVAQCIQGSGKDCGIVQSIFLLNIFKIIIGEEASILIVLFIYIILGGIIGYLFDKFKNRN